jgi:hypothetical protein
MPALAEVTSATLATGDERGLDTRVLAVRPRLARDYSIDNPRREKALFPAVDSATGLGRIPSGRCRLTTWHGILFCGLLALDECHWYRYRTHWGIKGGIGMGIATK